MKQRIKQSRKKRRLSQHDLAEKIGVSHSTLNRWEAGHREPKRDHLEALARELDISVEWLMFGDVPKPQTEAAAASSVSTQYYQPEAENFYRASFQKLETTMFKHPSEENPVIAYQGVPGAYSHLACREAFPDMEPMSCPSFEDAFEAVETGKAGLAMIPIENSLGGRVADIHHLLPESSLYIIGEHFQPVHHNILAPKGADLQSLKEVRSHTQALAQCRNTLRELKIDPVKHADTAGAAREIAELNDPTIGAVASSLAAETYDLEVLRNRVEDKIGNVTRFIVMSRTRIEPDPRSGPCLTSFVFQVRSIPAALYKSMGGFATNGVNFIKLESYISIADTGTARFYAEIEGHPADKAVDRAFEELQFFTSKVKILGTFQKRSLEK
ncbi:prephenate dehydratase [Curvivirga sp.]|uniref:prephenate dehydratase n=1 Tax=Curvivirga sp. TaxID=2856848 RepID=UPI003B5C5898